MRNYPIITWVSLKPRFQTYNYAKLPWPHGSSWNLGFKLSAVWNLGFKLLLLYPWNLGFTLLCAIRAWKTKVSNLKPKFHTFMCNSGLKNLGFNLKPRFQRLNVLMGSLKPWFLTFVKRISFCAPIGWKWMHNLKWISKNELSEFPSLKPRFQT